jgi:TrmH family RNA methyltransferase
MITVILVEPETPGNVGAIARVMANFDVKNLVLVNPCDYLSSEAIARSLYAQGILKKARVEKNCVFFKEYDLVIGTTCRLGTDYNIKRSPLLPSQLAEKLSQLKKKSKIALVFGRESRGLLNPELKLCDYSVTIPTSKKYASMNVSHAVAVVLYELTKKERGKEIVAPYTLASAKEKEQLEKLMNETIALLPFGTPQKFETQRIVWKQMIGKAQLTKREAFALFGYVRKVKQQLEK